MFSVGIFFRLQLIDIRLSCEGRKRGAFSILTLCILWMNLIIWKFWSEGVAFDQLWPVRSQLLWFFGPPHPGFFYWADFWLVGQPVHAQSSQHAICLISACCAVLLLSTVLQTDFTALRSSALRHVQGEWAELNWTACSFAFYCQSMQRNWAGISVQFSTVSLYMLTFVGLK